MNNLSEDILLKIFEYSSIKDKKKLCELNKDFYKLLNPLLQKYKLILFLNNDYLQFYRYLNIYDYKNEYEYMNKIIIKAFMNIPTIKATRICCMYDLRFVFELLYNKYRVKSNDIKIYNTHFYIHFYEKIINCIGKDRKETIENIEKSKYLFSLKQNPKFKDKDKNFKWISIIN